jgi:hypothetical protein
MSASFVVGPALPDWRSTRSSSSSSSGGSSTTSSADSPAPATGCFPSAPVSRCTRTRPRRRSRSPPETPACARTTTRRSSLTRLRRHLAAHAAAHVRLDASPGRPHRGRLGAARPQERRNHAEGVRRAPTGDGRARSSPRVLGTGAGRSRRRAAGPALLDRSLLEAVAICSVVVEQEAWQGSLDEARSATPCCGREVRVLGLAALCASLGRTNGMVERQIWPQDVRRRFRGL